MTKISKKLMDKFISTDTPGRIKPTWEMVRDRKLNRIKKIANRIRRNRARPDELIIFEKYKKEFGISEVRFDNYDKEWVLE